MRRINVRPVEQPAKIIDLHIGLCNSSHMATNLAIDDQILNEALKVGGHKTKKATVTEALKEYIQKRRQSEILDLFGKIDIDPKYDYKKQRLRR
ncbi:MAG: type II toxin-antitoxin system VapB family antitoxin [Pyrinomonadaceae bacterium]